uniref:Uncharacterized protein n=1 Tax=Campylobacter phage vB_CJ12660_3PH123 TaxID=3236702 RepID=A0AB39C5J8_9VIRU
MINYSKIFAKNENKGCGKFPYPYNSDIIL